MMRRWTQIGFRCDGEAYRIVDATAELEPVGFSRVPHASLPQLLTRWEQLSRGSVLAELAQTLGLHSVPTRSPSHALSAALWGKVVLRQQRVSVASNATAEPVSLVQLLPPIDELESSVEHFVELAFADDDGEPMAGVACQVTLPDGRTRQARSNDAGAIRIEGLTRAGQCVVSFDGHDDMPRTPQPGDKPITSPPPPTPDQRFAVVLVDEIGEPLVGATLSFTGTEVGEAVTDDAGRVELTAEQVQTCSVRVDYDAIVEELVARWTSVRAGALVEDNDQATVRLLGDDNPALVFSGEEHRLSVQPRVDRFIAEGLLFETDKNFLLPSALPAMTTVVTHYGRTPGFEVLVVGHTDRTGAVAHNDALSLSRAEAMAAFLRDDVQPWLSQYEASVPAAQRWGTHEDALMLAALPDVAARPAGVGAVQHFQQTRGLLVDGVAGPQTRQALIADYMATDGTTLPSDATLFAHGAGEHFSRSDAPDGTDSAEDRRVEVFFFPPATGVLPPPPAANSGPDDPEYPEWVRRAVNTLQEQVEDALQTLSWREGTVDDSEQPTFVIRDTETEEHQQRNAALTTHDLSALPNDRIVELGVHQSVDLNPVRHRHRVDIGRLRAALRLSDSALVVQAMALVIEEGRTFGPLPDASFPWEGEPVTEEKVAGLF